MTEFGYKLDLPRNTVFCHHLWREKMTPWSRKSGDGLLLGWKSTLDRGSDEHTCFGDVRTKNGQETEKSSPTVRIPYRNRSSVVELVGYDRLLFAKVKNGVSTWQNAIFILAWNFPCFRVGSLVVSESQDRRDTVSKKTSEKRKRTVTHRLTLSSSLSPLHATSMRHRCCPSSSTALRLSSRRFI